MRALVFDAGAAARAADGEGVLRACAREALFAPAVLYVDVEDDAELRLAERLEAAAVVIGGPRRNAPRRRTPVRFDVAKPSGEEQRALWRAALGADDELDALVEHFDLSAGEIAAAAARAAGERGTPGGAWQATLRSTRPRFGDLAARVESDASWATLVLPDAVVGALRGIVAQVRHRALVHDGWGFAAPGARGRGVAALFAGASGTGKTTAAELIARELGFDLYRVDLAGVVSKYIGETEKNLRRLFDAAEAGGCVLLFDEAEALFGKRGEIRDGHDRYANAEVDYLLQRVEAFRGVAILASNAKAQLDGAFLRRLRYVVTFPFPDAAQRARIWARAFPPGAPLGAIGYDRLARLELSGGSIRNAALHAAFLAAERGEPIADAHLRDAVRAEFAKLERPYTERPVTTDLRIERLRLDLGDFTTDPERLRRLAERVAALLAQRVDARAPQGAGAHRAGDLHVHVGGPGARPHADERDDERVAGTIADAVADALLGRLLMTRPVPGGS